MKNNEPEVDLSHLKDVDEAAGRGDHDLAAVLDVADLGSLGSAAEEARVLDLGGLAELLGDLLNLLRKFPRGGKD